MYDGQQTQLSLGSPRPLISPPPPSPGSSLFSLHLSGARDFVQSFVLQMYTVQLRGVRGQQASKGGA